MKTKFELGEEVFVKARIIRISYNPHDEPEKVRYDIAFVTDRGNTLTFNGMSDEQIERMVQG